MEVGDFIQWQGRKWLVRRVDEESVTAFAEDANGVTLVADLYHQPSDDLKILCNPLHDWPSVSLPVKSRSRLVEVLHGSKTLVRFQDWVKVDEFQMGGLLYLNPALNLGFRDRLTAVFTLVGSTRINRAPVEIPRNFSSATEKNARRDAPPPPPPPNRTIYDVVLSDDDEL